MFNELTALSAPESLWLNTVGLICFAAFALAAIGGMPDKRQLIKLWEVGLSGYRARSTRGRAQR
jgi:hypothetical protein